MTDEQNFNQTIHACALGCMDKEEYIDLTEYLDSGQSFNWAELGEYQNLASLLPSFLNIETPDNSVKSQVAQRLYKLKEEKKLAATGAKKQAAPLPPPVQASPAVPSPAAPMTAPARFSAPNRGAVSGRPSQSTQVSIRGQEPSSPPRIEDTDRDIRLNLPGSFSSPESVPEPAAESGGISLNFDVIEEQLHENVTEREEPQPVTPIYTPDPEPSQEEQPVYIPPVQAENIESPPTGQTFIQPQVQTEASEQPIIINKGISAYIFIPIVLILLGAVGALYYVLEESVSGLKNNISTEVRNQTEPLNEQIALLNKQQEVITLLQQPDIIYAELKPVRGSEAFGKLMYSPSLKKGQLHMGNLRVIPSADQKVYQLWVSGKKTSVFVDISYSSSDLDFIPVNISGDFSKERTLNVLITREKVGTTPASPSKEVELTGLINIK